MAAPPANPTETATPGVSRAAPAPAGALPQAAWSGWFWGALGVLIFAATLPMTRLAVGDAAAPQLPPAFVTAGRAAVAGLLSVAWLLAVRAPWPPRALWPWIALSALGTVLGFPGFLALALREVPSSHAAVVTGLLPLATAAVAALLNRQRAGLAFWLCAGLGAALVLGFAAWKGGGHWVPADALLLGAVAAGAVGYVAGARVSAVLSAPATICWVLVASLPFTWPAAWATRPLAGLGAQASASAWLGFAYVSLFSMWLGFFAWYRGLALGGVMRVSQIQLLQPFLAVLLAAPILGEPIEPGTLGFALAVMAVVLLSRQLPRPR